MKPKISMIVISYNGGERLIPTLESHKRQTYPDKELIIADDASPDGVTQKIIEDWLSENEHYFKRVVFIKNPVNLGAVKNFKTAVLQATGDVIFQTEQGDVIYGQQTIEKLSNEIERQRLSGLADPYLWLGDIMGFSFVNGEKIINKKLYFCSRPENFNLIEKSPGKALKKAMHKCLIGGSSMIFSSKYFDDDIYPHYGKSRNTGDCYCLLWNLINGHRIRIIRQFIHWYEFGVGISSRPNSKILSDIEFIAEWLMEIDPRVGMEYARTQVLEQEYCVRCKNRWERMTRHPFVFSKNAADFVWNKLRTLTGYQDRWITELAQNSSASFGDELFRSEYYPDKPNGIF